MDKIYSSSYSIGDGTASRPPVIALAGNPNVGKSTLFNALTGMNQHTGNWAGKTVEVAEGRYSTKCGERRLIDLPGTYSLFAHSKEESVAADFIALGGADLTVIVLDACCLLRSLNLALQALDVSKRAVICLNLWDEAEKKGVRIDTDSLSRHLGAPVVCTVARRRHTLDKLRAAIDKALTDPPRESRALQYEKDVTEPLLPLCRYYEESLGASPAAAELLAARRITCSDGEKGHRDEDKEASALDESVRAMNLVSLSPSVLSDMMSEHILSVANDIARSSVKCQGRGCRSGALDRLLTGRLTSFPIMILGLVGIMFITVTLANYPSELLSFAFERLGDLILRGLTEINAPRAVIGILYEGIYCVLTRVVSVMLPPMAIFFPLFTLLEDAGILPRIAYNLDAPFRCAGACGKQGLTMCMSLGCTAVGITGCRIIDSPRERRIAVITSSLVPCNGKFPTIILIVGCFLSAGGGIGDGLISALALSLVIILGVGATFLASLFLSKTVYRGTESFFTIELPPYRRPDFLRVLFRSFIDRTLKVLGRAAVVALPAGIILWVMVSVRIDGVSLLGYVTDFLDPAGRLMGMDGVMLTAFILGLPANEIVLPIAVMGYAEMGTGAALSADVGEVLAQAGWSPVTAICVILFSLMHWPCSTSIITAWRETKSVPTTLLTVFLPTVMGCTACITVNLIAKLLAW